MALFPSFISVRCSRLLTACVIGLVLLTAGCGNKGSLFLPDTPPPQDENQQSGSKNKESLIP